MSGWLLVVQSKEKFNKNADRFKKLFSLEHLPKLNCDIRSYGDDSFLLLWAWSTKKNISDISYSSFSQSHQLIMIEGMITSFGKFGYVPGNGDKTAAKMLELWNRYGSETIAELDGSFTIVIHDYNKKSTLLITDRIASRSAWYFQNRFSRILGNFPSAIAAACDGSLEIDAAALWSLLSTSRPLGNRSIFTGIKSLQAGKIAYFRTENKKKIKSWHELKYQPDYSLKPKHWGEIIAKNLKTSAERLIHFSPNSYLFLSGGMDSRVAAAAFGEKIKTITLTTEPNMNSRISEKVAASLNIKHKTMIRDPYWYLDSFEAAALISGGNYNIIHAHFIKPVQEIVEKDPEASFLLGDMLENFNKHYFKPVFKSPDDIKPKH